MTKLSVNVNKIALIRNSRDTDYPNVAHMAQRAIAAGAHGITVHPRPDQRHIRYSDVHELSVLTGRHPDVEFNIEGLLRGDSASRSAFYQSGLTNGWLTINEVRERENLSPVEGGDVPRMQMQNVPITEAGSKLEAGNGNDA